jgi:nucleotide-binding universal stress UspA family protein
MNTKGSILIAVDDSEVSHRAVEYVATILGRRRGFRVYPLHILPSFPPELLEHGGSENPDVEGEIEAKMRSKQSDWLEEAKRASRPILEKAQAMLHDAGVPVRSITTRFYAPISGENLASDILL